VASGINGGEVDAPGAGDVEGVQTAAAVEGHDVHQGAKFDGVAPGDRGRRHRVRVRVAVRLVVDDQRIEARAAGDIQGGDGVQVMDRRADVDGNVAEAHLADGSAVKGFEQVDGAPTGSDIDLK